jgi:hypothetical protein
MYNGDADRQTKGQTNISINFGTKGRTEKEQKHKQTEECRDRDTDRQTK